MLREAPQAYKHCRELEAYTREVQWEAHYSIGQRRFFLFFTELIEHLDFCSDAVFLGRVFVARDMTLILVRRRA